MSAAVFEDDFPTGPIDMFDLSNPEVKSLISEKTVVDELGNLHDQKGRFTFKNKKVEYANLQQPEVPVRIMPYEQVPLSVMSIAYGEVNQTGIRYEDLQDGSQRVFQNGRLAYISTRPRRPDGSNLVYPDDRRFAKLNAQPLAEGPVAKPKPPSPAIIRAWAQAEGYDVPARGRLPLEIMNAYMRAH